MPENLLKPQGDERTDPLTYTDNEKIVQLLRENRLDEARAIVIEYDKRKTAINLLNGNSN